MVEAILVDFPAVVLTAIFAACSFFRFSFCPVIRCCIFFCCILCVLECKSSFPLLTVVNEGGGVEPAKEDSCNVRPSKVTSDSWDSSPKSSRPMSLMEAMVSLSESAQEPAGECIWESIRSRSISGVALQTGGSSLFCLINIDSSINFTPSLHLYLPSILMVQLRFYPSQFLPFSAIILINSTKNQHKQAESAYYNDQICSITCLFDCGFYNRRMEKNKADILKTVLLLALLTMASSLSSGTIQTTYHTVSYNLIATLPLGPAAGGSDNCEKMVPKWDGLYHIQEQGGTSYLQKWDWPITASSTISQTYTFDYKFEDWDSEYYSSRLAIYNKGTKQLEVYDDIYAFNGTPSAVYPSNGPTGKHVVLMEETAYVHQDNGGSDDSGLLINLTNGTESRVQLGQKDAKVSVTPDQQKIVSWDKMTDVQVRSTSDISFLYHYTGVKLASADDLTNHVEFSSDSELAIIETDGSSNTIIMNMTDYTVQNSFSFPESSISRAAYVPNTDLILMLSPSRIYILDLATNNPIWLADLGFNLASSMFDPRNNTLFVCYDQQIRVIGIDTGVSPYNSSWPWANTTANATNTTNSSSNTTSNGTNTTGNSTGNTINGTSNTTNSSSNVTSNGTNATGNSTGNTTNGTNNTTNGTSNFTTMTTQYDPLTDPQTVISLTMSEGQAQMTEALSNGLESTGSVMDKIILVALSNPFTYYFLSFNNFFTVSSHYVLLNMPIPKALYEYLSHFYVEVNTNAVGRLWQLPFGQLTAQSVSRENLRSLGLTTDFAIAQTANILMTAINVILFQAISCVISRLSRGNMLRKLLEQPPSEIIQGQYISLIMPLTSPWVFFMLISGVSKPIFKLNVLIQHFFFCLNVAFIIYFLFNLAQAPIKKAAAQTLLPPRVDSHKTATSQDKAYHRQRHNSKHYIIRPATTAKSQSKLQRNNSCQSEHKKPSQIARKYRTQTRDRCYYQRKYLSRKKLAASKRVNFYQDCPQIKTFQNGKGQDIAYYEDSRGLRWQASTTSQRTATNKFQLSKKHKPLHTLPFSRVMTAAVLQEWYVVFSNFIYPLLLVVPSSFVPLSLLSFYSLLGLIIAFKLQDFRFNPVILSLYAVLFHLCFIVLRVTSNNSILVYTQIACLAILLLGSVHHFLFMVFTFVRAFYLHYSEKSRIKPSNLSQNKKKEGCRIQSQNQNNIDPRPTSTLTGSKKSGLSGKVQMERSIGRGFKIKKVRKQRREDAISFANQSQQR